MALPPINIICAVIRRLIFRRRPATKDAVRDLQYWQDRAERFGRRSVLNITHADAEYDEITQFQKLLLIPLLSRQLTGSETLILDFGCGPGRFTRELAETIGYYIGLDPTLSLLNLAPRGSSISYIGAAGDCIPITSSCVDVVWCCLVLGGIDGGALERSVAEINRVLAPRGLLYLVENTSELQDAPHWRFRTSIQYAELFSSISLHLIGGYKDGGENISILAGRKH